MCRTRLRTDPAETLRTSTNEGSAAMYTPQQSLRDGLNEPQRETLTRFEQVDQPTAWQRGVLSSIRMCATSSEDQMRVDAVRQKWANTKSKQS